MKKKLAIMMAAVFALGAFAACGSGSTEEASAVSKQTETPTPTATSTPTETPTPTPEETFDMELGEKTDTSLEIKLTNSTGKNIKNISLVYSASAEEPATLIEEGNVWSDGGVVLLYCEPTKEADEIEQTETVDASEGTDFAIAETCQAVLTWEDDTTYTLTVFPVKDMEECEIKSEDDVVFVEYTSLSTDEAVSTKEAEKAVLDAAAAQAQAEADAAAAQAQAEAEAAAQAQAEAEAAAQAAAAQAEAEAAAQVQAEAEAAAQAAAAQAAAEAAAAAQAQTAQQAAAQQAASQAQQSVEGCLN